MSKEDCDILVNLLIIGDHGVGKTSLVSRFTDGTFHEDADASSAVDFSVKKMKLDDRRVRLHIWDTAGTERVQAVSQKFYRGTNGVLFAFDVSEKRSFENVARWIEDVQRNYPQPNLLQRHLVACKSDLQQRRMVSSDEALSFAELNSMPYVETSAKNGENVDEPFMALLQSVMSQSPLNLLPESWLGNNKKQSSRMCCPQ